MSFRTFVLVLLSLGLSPAFAGDSSCLVGKKRIITVTVLRDAANGRGKETLESVSVHLDGRPISTMRTRAASNEGWRIPSLCKPEMEATLTQTEIGYVLVAIAGEKKKR